MRPINKINKMNKTIKICSKCEREMPISKLTGMSIKRQVTFECIDEKDCRENNKKLIDDENKNKLIEDNKIIHKDLPKEEQMKAIYGIDYDQLIEIPQRFRDASIHYYHPPSDKVYSFSFCNNKWKEQMTNTLKQYIK